MRCTACNGLIIIDSWRDETCANCGRVPGWDGPHVEGITLRVNGPPWTEAEDALLIRLRDQDGISWERTSKALNRGIDAVKLRHSRLKNGATNVPR